jgi:nitroreductase
MRLSLAADDVLTTTRAVRKRLDLERPVEREVIRECVEIALQAPTGSNMQRWHWIFVDDPDKKRMLAELYNRTWAGAYSPEMVSRLQGADLRVWASADYLAQHLHEVPVLLVPCQWGRPPAGDDPAQAAGYWGSLLPAVWSFCLAARERGLGTAWTSAHLNDEREAADLLGIPYERCAQGGLIPVAYTVGTDFKVAARRSADEVIHWNSW